MSKTLAEIQAVISEQRLSKDRRSKLPPAASYQLKLGQRARVYREKERSWDGPFEVIRVEDKIVTATIEKEAKLFNKCKVLPVPKN